MRPANSSLGLFEARKKNGKRFDFGPQCPYVVFMIDDNDSLARTAHAFGMTDVEFTAREGFRPAEDLPIPPLRPSGVQPLPQVENSPSELDELILDFPSVEDYGEDWEEYMLHGDPNWD